MGAIERAVTIAARGVAALLAIAGLVGIGWGGRGFVGDAAIDVMRGWRGVVVAIVIVAGGVGAWRGWGPGRLVMRIPRRGFVAGAIVVALASGVWAHHAIHKGVPDVPDELGYLHQARTFAEGALAAPSPPAPEFHYVSWGVHDHDRWYAVFPPGYGVLLAAGEVAGAPGWVNPMLGAALVLLLFLLAEDLLGRDGAGARWVVLLYLASWFRLMHAGSFMAHPTSALAAVAAVLGLLRGVLWARDHGWGWAAAGGAALAYLGATRQLDAVIVAAAIAPAIGLGLVRGKIVAARRLAIAIACGLPIAAGYLAYNRALTGDAWLPPQQHYMQLKERRGDCFRLGFGPGVGECPITQNTHFGPKGFQPKHAVANTEKRLDAWLRWSFGWAPFALLAIGGLVGAAVRGGGDARRRALVGAIFAATVVGYGLFFYHGVIYGARFYYVAWPFVLIASAGALLDAERLLAGVRHERVRSIAAGALAAAVPALLVAGMIAAWPSVKQHAGRRPRTQDGALVRALDAPALRDALVFVDSMTLPATVTADPVTPAHNRPLVVKDLGDAANAGYARLYPDRRPLRMQGKKLTPLPYAADAPMRHEGGAMYPLDDARGGFADRGTAPGLGGLALSGGEALRFVIDRPGARFSVPLWAIAADAGPMTIVIALVRHPNSPAVELRLDGAPLATALPTAAPAWAIDPIELPVTLAPGRHRLEVRIPDGRKGQVFAFDYVELRRAPGP